MKNLITQFRIAAKKRAAYRRTRDELRALPRDVALDIDIMPEDAPKIARQVVYGA